VLFVVIRTRRDHQHPGHAGQIDARQHRTPSSGLGDLFAAWRRTNLCLPEEFAAQTRRRYSRFSAMQPLGSSSSIPEISDDS
jgi:hypothetical protein